MLEKIGGRQISMMYKLRSRILRKSAKFSMGQECREIRCLEVLRDLVVGERATVTLTSNPLLMIFTRIICKSTRRAQGHTHLEQPSGD